VSEILKCLIKVDHVFFPKGKRIEAGDWAAFNASVIDIYEGTPWYKSGKRISVSGIVPETDFFKNYVLLAKATDHETYGRQYEILCMSQEVNLDDPVEQRIFLEHVLSDHQINLLYESLENPFDAIANMDIAALTSVKGIGEESAKKIIQRYNDNINNGLAYVELDSYGLTKYMIDKLIEIYRSADIVVNKIKENPYILIEEIDGIGWAKADEMALNAGMDNESPNRISAYIVHHLKSTIEDGDTWTTPGELIETTFEILGIDNQDAFREALYALHDKNILWWDDDKTKIALTQFYKLEADIAMELHRLLAAPSNFNYDNFDLKIRSIERAQGNDFTFTEEQKEAVKQVLSHQVSIITGFGGTGKSTVVSGVLKLLGDCSFAQTALSGRAASRLSEITNAEGYTIHRLLEYQPPVFTKDRYNKLSQDVIILDEISMVGAELFYSLIQAIQTGSKLIMIGDDGQLESIGLCNIFKDMLDSGIIPVAKLTKIHRQAAKSAIITESVKVRHHEQLVPNKWVGEEIRGELQDLELNIYNDAILSQRRIITKFKELYEKCADITKIQIVVPMRVKGDISTLALNKLVQDIVNPLGANPTTIQVNAKRGESYFYTLREDDKVIITKNNYKTMTPQGTLCPVFNGNLGIIQTIDDFNNEITINFEQHGPVIIKKKEWNTIELGYALTCHKLQGSEAEYVIIGLDYTCRALLTKEWLYTAITRAKKYCVLCAETNALNFCITNSNVPYKRTFLQQLLQNKMQSISDEHLNLTNEQKCAVC